MQPETSNANASTNEAPPLSVTLTLNEKEIATLINAANFHAARLKMWAEVAESDAITAVYEADAAGYSAIAAKLASINALHISPLGIDPTPRPVHIGLRSRVEPL